MNDTRNAFAPIRALILFILAYVLVTVLAAATTMAYDSICHPPPEEFQVSILEAPAFVATVLG